VSPRLKRLSGRDVIRALRSFGFEVVNTRGSHAKLRRIGADGFRQILTVPLHDELAPGTLHAVYRQVLRFVPESEVKPHFFTE
jgi:predicted RNA binding protein YcfA (HicA-like mRNA interferase family)